MARHNRKFTAKNLEQHIYSELLRINNNASVDPEAAHSTRDALYEWWVRTVANSNPGPRVTIRLSKLVIKAADIKFKWTASA